MNRNELIQLLGFANEFKDGDVAIGVGTTDEARREEARRELARVRLADVCSCDLVEDALTEAMKALFTGDAAACAAYEKIRNKPVGEVRDALLAAPDPRAVKEIAAGLTSEMIAAVTKLLTNEELTRLSAALFNPLGGPGSVGSRECFGSRIQPNSPTDDPTEVLYSIFEGVSYGCGDVIIGINPANDTVDEIIEMENLLATVVERLRLPTRWCVLSDMKKQREALARKARVDVGFQSLAGTSKALIGMLGCDVGDLLELCRSFNGLYFETGQGSEFTNGADGGVDMVTLESRTYGMAKLLSRRTRKWQIVNDVSGFIGPEVFKTPAQLLRACLEDLFMGKMHGLAMGLDVCSTYHMGISPAVLDELTERIVLAGPAYLMAVAGKADPMLGYLTTESRCHPRLRNTCHKSMTAQWTRRLVELGITCAGDLAPVARAFGEAPAHIAKTVTRLQERGLDIGYGYEKDFRAPGPVWTRLENIYKHARRALYRTIEPETISGASRSYIKVRTASKTRDEYIARPVTGERLAVSDAAAIKAMYATGAIPDVQIVVSDGLNADAVNENLRDLLPALRERVQKLGLSCGKDIFVENGRVRAGYHIGEVLNAPVLVHLIGERPGTGLNCLSAYITYGRTPLGASRWPGIEHSDTTALCSINKRAGVKPEEAALRIARLVDAMVKHRCSGVALAPHQNKKPGF